MNRILTASETVQLLNELRGALQQFATRAEALDAELKAKTDAAGRKLKVGLHDLNARTLDDVAAAQSAYEKKKQEIEERYQDRARRIVRAQATSRKMRMDAIEAIEGRRKYAVQKGTLDAEKRRDELLAKADSDYAAMQGRFSELWGRFAQIDEEARKALRGFRSFSKSLDDQSLGQSEFQEDEHQLLERGQALESEAREELERFKRAILPKLFRFIRLWVWIVASAGAAAFFLLSGDVRSPATTRNAGIANSGSFAYPVIANGKLYLRELNSLWCYDVKAN